MRHKEPVSTISLNEDAVMELLSKAIADLGYEVFDSQIYRDNNSEIGADFRVKGNVLIRKEALT